MGNQVTTHQSPDLVQSIVDYFDTQNPNLFSQVHQNPLRTIHTWDHKSSFLMSSHLLSRTAVKELRQDHLPSIHREERVDWPKFHVPFQRSSNTNFTVVHLRPSVSGRLRSTLPLDESPVNPPVTTILVFYWDERVDFAKTPCYVPAIIKYKLHHGPFKTFRLGENAIGPTSWWITSQST